MTTLPALPPSPAPAAGGMPVGTGPAGSDGGAFAGLLAPDAAVPGAAERTSGSVTADPLPVDEAAPDLLEDGAEGALRPDVEPTAAQIIVAAQVTPVGPMLANAPRLTPSYAEVAPASAPSADPAVAPSSPTKSSVLTPETALFVGHLGVAAGQHLGSTGQVISGPSVGPPAVEGTVQGAAVLNGAVEGQVQEGQAPEGAPPEPASVPGQSIAGQAGDDLGQAGSHTTHQPGNQPGDQPGNQPGAQAGTEPTTAAPGEPAPTDTQPTGTQPTSSQRSDTQAAGTQPTAAQTSAVTGLTAPGSTAPTPSTPGGTAVANPVAGQVFPEVTRLVSRGDGTRRITLQLSPEALGDVRVVLTVRNGEVQVRMSGGELAQQALLAGAPELHKLLDLAGATSSQIQVGTQSSTNALDQSLDQHSQQRAQDGELQQDNQNHRTAGTRDGDTSARDGAPRGTHPHPATNPGTRTRTTGVDVTM